MEGGPVKTRPLGPLEAVRAFGVMLGGPIVLAAWMAASIAAVARAVLSLRPPPPLALFGTAATALYAFVIRPWHRRWGANRRTRSASCRATSFRPKPGCRSSTR